MAAYPSLAQLVGSTEEWVDDVEVDRAVGGSTKARSFFPAKKRRFTIKHVLTAADRSTLQTFYNTNRALAVTLTWTGDSQAYTCLFEQAPRLDYIGGGLAKVEVRLVEQ